MNITQRKGVAIMHDIEPVVIWVFAVNMGMILTMAMTALAAQPRRYAISQDANEHMPAHHIADRQEGLLIPITVRPLSMPRVTNERETTGPAQAA
jgi:hypothetical protein